jgi:hypothetical protein
MEEMEEEISQLHVPAALAQEKEPPWVIRKAKV